MKTKLSFLAILTLCLFSASALNAGPIITKIVDDGDALTLDLPAGQAIVILNCASEQEAAGYVRVDSVNTPTIKSLTLLLPAKVSYPDKIDQGASTRQITIAGPAKIGAFSTTPMLVTYKLINNN